MISELDESGDGGPPGAGVGKTARELFSETLEGDYDDDGPWDAVAALRRQNTPEVFQLAVEFCRSAIPLQRARGLDVLGQLGVRDPMSERPYFDDCVSTAIRHLTDENPMVVRSAAWALAHLKDDRAISALLDLRGAADSGVRWAVAVALAGSQHAEAIQALMELMEDADDDVRDWATFGLGTQSTADSRQIREAFRKRLADANKDARDEAIWGLAYRKDPAGLRMLVDRLEADEYVGGDELTAADILGLFQSADTPVPDLCRGLRQILDDLEKQRGVILTSDS